MYDAIADTVADVETDIIITMGAGSIDRLVSQIKDSLIKKYALSEQI
jgi:UDP-N-acetylmuramate-alanine ligase